MIFKNREEAGEQLAEKIIQKKIINPKDETIIVSLLRGGVLIGDKISQKLKSPHLGLPVAKISSPYQEELAIGALCFDKIYWEKSIINSFNFKKSIINNQIKKAKEKFINYCHDFNIKKKDFDQIREKVIILTDDGIATGASINAGFLFLKSKKPKQIVLATPVAPFDFKEDKFRQSIILFKDPFLSAVSQYYQDFPQISSDLVKKILANKKIN